MSSNLASGPQLVRSTWESEPRLLVPRVQAVSSGPHLSVLHTVPGPLTEVLPFSQTELGFILCSGMKKAHEGRSQMYR